VGVQGKPRPLWLKNKILQLLSSYRSLPSTWNILPIHPLKICYGTNNSDFAKSREPCLLVKLLYTFLPKLSDLVGFP
jgi:hypothetical protein